MGKVNSLYVFAMIALLCFASCKTQKISVTGSLFEQPCSTQVQNQFAATILTNRQDSDVVRFYAQYENAELNNSLLEKITTTHSLDVSTLFLMEKLYQQPKNKIAQNDYLASMAALSKTASESNLDFLKDYYLVFIPGFRYNSNAGNFAEQRKMLDFAKISHEMILINEIGNIDDNAQLIAKRLQKINHEHKNIILISVSKGGTETAKAISDLLKPEELSSVTAWINVCGILQGTPVADYWAVPFRKIFLSTGLFFVGKGSVNIKAIMKDLSYERLKGTVYNIPKNIYTISFLATSLGKRRNKVMMPVPNDGYSPLLDEIIDDGTVVVEIRSNHTMKGLNLNNSMIALLQHIVKHKKEEVK